VKPDFTQSVTTFTVEVTKLFYFIDFLGDVGMVHLNVCYDLSLNEVGVMFSLRKVFSSSLLSC
jgi:hypothetical protein